MINFEVVEFIRKQTQAGVGQDKIKSDLISNGWTSDDISEAFAATARPTMPRPPIAVTKESSGKRIAMFVVLFVLIVLGGGGAFAYKTYYKDYIAQKEKDEIRKSNYTATPPAAALKPVEKAPQNESPDELWSTFDKVTLALKNEDVASYNLYSYEPIPKDQEPQFTMFASFMYEAYSKINKADFVNKWEDDKQTIYLTNPIRQDDVNFYSYRKAGVMFIKHDGLWKVLNITNKGTSHTKKNTNSTVAQIDLNLQAMMLDTDKDGLTDMNETCSGTSQGDKSCVKTDPNKRDTDGDGWWDGIEAEMK